MKMKITNNAKYIKGTTLSIIAATFLLSGCGSNGIDDVYDRSGEETTQSDYTVQVVDDAVKGAKIMANECTGYQETGDGYYTLTGCTSRPKAIIADGGYMTIDDKNVSMGFPLMVNTNMIAQSTSYTATPLTTLLATVNDYAELQKLQQSLGFSDIQDMFKDSNATRDLQRTLNSYYIEAKNNGIDINNFADFTKDFRAMVTQASGSDGLTVIKDAKTKLKADFDASPGKYMDKYGVVFSGFVTSTDYKDITSGTKDLLKNIGTKFQGDKKQIVFSGFIFDDIIGKGNGDKYTQNATISLINLDTNQSLQITDDNNLSLTATNYGQYTLKIPENNITENGVYKLQGTVTNRDGKKIELNSILTGKEILGKFKSTLTSADIPDITLSNVTTAKVAILEAQGNLNQSVDSIIAAKKDIETNVTKKELLVTVAAGIKSIIDKNVTMESTNTNITTFSYIKEQLTTSGTTVTFTTPTTGGMTEVLTEVKKEITDNKTLNAQLTSTKYEKFKIPEVDIGGKRVTFMVNGDSFPTTIQLFKDKSYTLEARRNDLTPIFEIGKWFINEFGDLVLTNIENNPSALDAMTTISLDKTKMSEATYTAGQFTGTTTNPKGSITKETISNNLDVTTITDIDLTKQTPPMVEFKADNLKNKKLFEVYSSNGNYEDAVYIFDGNGTSVNYTEDVKDETNKSLKTASFSNGILTVSGIGSYKIKKSYPTKIVALKNDSEEVELFYSSINAVAAKEIKTYDNSSYKTDKIANSYWKINQEDNNNPNFNTANLDNFTLKAVPLANNLLNYNKSTVSIVSKWTDHNNTRDIGTRVELAVTENLGDSARQRAQTSTRYWLPSFGYPAAELQGQLLVDVQIRYNKIVYNLRLRDSNDNEYTILDTPVTILEENTINKKYSVMTVLKENKIAIQVSDGVNAYYQYVDLTSLWNSKSAELKYYKYPVSMRNTSITASLYDDGTGKLFEGRMNTPIGLKVSKFETINGNEVNNYEGGHSSVCVQKNADTTPDNYSFTAATLADFSSPVESNTVTVSGINASVPISISSGGQYSLDNGSTWTSEVGTVSNGQTVKVKVNASSASNTTTSATLNIGGVAKTFTVTTKDTIPNNFGFTSVTGANPSTATESNSITIGGINAPTTISISGGEFSINGSTTWQTSGTVSNGQTIKVKVTSAGSYSTQATASLTIGGVSSNFVVTTKVAPPVSQSDPYSSSNYLTVSSDFIAFAHPITSSEYNTTATKSPSILATTNLYELANSSSSGMQANKISFASNKQTATNILANPQTTVELGNYTVGSDQSLIFSDKNMKYAGIFDATLLNTTGREVFKTGSKAYAFNILSNAKTIYSDSNISGYSTIDSYLGSSDMLNFTYPVNSVTVKVAPFSATVPYQEELETPFTSLTTTSFNALTAANPSVLIGQDLYEMDYRRGWNGATTVYGSKINQVSITNTTIGMETILAPSTDSYDNWEDNISISNNIVNINNGDARFKYIETLNASTLNSTMNKDIFANGKAYKVAYVRDRDEYDWYEEDWAYPKDSNNTTFTTLDSFITHRMANQNWNLDCNSDSKCYTFASSSNKTSGNLVDNQNNSIGVGTWSIVDNIIVTNITNTAYMHDEGVDSWITLFRVNSTNGKVQKGEKGLAGQGVNFYWFDATAKNEWLEYFSGMPKSGNLINASNSSQTVGTWSKTKVDNKNAIVWTINGYPNKPSFIEDSGTLRQALQVAPSTNVKYLFDENAKNDWINYYSPYPQSAGVDSVFGTTTVASVANAKTMVTNLRELTNSLYVEDSNGTKTSGLLVTQDDLHTNKIQSVLTTFENDIDATGTAITALGDNFSTKVETDLNTTMEAIDLRLSAISNAINTQMENNVTSISVVNGGQTIAFAATYDNKGEVTTMTASNVTLSGTGYNLSIPSLTFNWNGSTYSTIANGTASISNAATTFTGNIAINTVIRDRDENTSVENDFDFINKLIFTLNGHIVSDGRVFDGNVSINAENGNYSLAGKLVGKTGEPTVEGSLAANIALLDLKKINGENEVQWGYISNSYNGFDNFTIVAKDSNGAYRLMSNSYNVPLGSTTPLNYTSGNYTAEKYNFKFTIVANGQTYRGYLKSFNMYTSGAYYGIEMENSWNWLSLNYNTSSGFTLNFWDNNTGQSSSVAVTSLSVEPIERVYMDNIPQSYLFRGNITHTTGSKTNAATLNLALNKPNNSKSIEGKITNLTFGNNSVNLTANEIGYTHNIVQNYEGATLEQVTKSTTLKGLRGTVIDTSSATLALDINGTVSKTYLDYGNDYVQVIHHNPDYDYDSKQVIHNGMDINTTYSYGGTVFSGRLTANLNNPDADDDWYYSGNPITTGNMKFVGSLSANNFVPFNLTLEAKLTGTNSVRTEAATLLMNRDGYSVAGVPFPSYSLASKLITTYTGNISAYRWDKTSTKLDIKDSNGVTASESRTNGTSFDSIVFKNISGTTLGTYGKDLTGNSWEIRYTDGTSTSVF
jgi:hypothetical protein